MTPGLDAASIFTARQDPPAEVAQFEPDFDGTWDQPAACGEVGDGMDDPQWIVWPSRDVISLWAGGLPGTGRLVGL